MTYLDITIKQFNHIKKRAEDGLSQLNDDEFFHHPNEASNSAAVILKHLSGNMHSRWKKFLTEDGEKPFRKRKEEFKYAGEKREFLMQQWEDGWSLLFNTLKELTDSDLNRTVYLRKQPLSVMEAVQIELSHLSYHLGQILYIGKLLKNNDWKILSIK